MDSWPLGVATIPRRALGSRLLGPPVWPRSLGARTLAMRDVRFGHGFGVIARCGRCVPWSALRENDLVASLRSGGKRLFLNLRRRKFVSVSPCTRNPGLSRADGV